MVLNSKKTNLLVINPTYTLLAVPFITLKDGEPLLCVDTMKLLGLTFDHKMTWWPIVTSLVERTR